LSSRSPSSSSSSSISLTSISLTSKQVSLTSKLALSTLTRLVNAVVSPVMLVSRTHRLSASNNPPLASCTQHMPFWVRAPAGLCVAPFSTFKVCFKLPHATYLTTHAVVFWLFRWGLFVRWKEHTPLSLSHPFWIWSRVSLNMEPLRENQTKITRLLVAQPRAPAGRRAHATNTRLL
jgi:hypothetical protein